MSRLTRILLQPPIGVVFEVGQVNDKLDFIYISGNYSSFVHKIDKLNYKVWESEPDKLNIKTAQFFSWLKTYFARYYFRAIPHVNAYLSSTWVKIRRMFIGAGVGFKKYLRVRGVGYSFKLEKGILTAKVGYTHFLQKTLPVDFTTRFSRKFKVVRLRSHSLTTLTLFLARLRVLRRPDIYKGKGIRYRRDPIRRKPGKRKTKAVGRKNKFNKRKIVVFRKKFTKYRRSNRSNKRHKTQKLFFTNAAKDDRA